jgi:hypothetical protein
MTTHFDVAHRPGKPIPDPDLLIQRCFGVLFEHSGKPCSWSKPSPTIASGSSPSTQPSRRSPASHANRSPAHWSRTSFRRHRSTWRSAITGAHCAKAWL